MKKFFSYLIVAAIFTTSVSMISCSGDKTFYTVTFNSDGGTAVQSQKVEAGGTANAPNHPTKQGYVFMFWSLSGATTAYDFATPVNSNINLIAKWKDEATVEYWQVTWNLNGGAFPTSSNHATQVVKGGTLAEPNEPTKANSKFEGWYLEAALTNKITFPFNVSGITANFTLYAKWTSGGGGTQVTALTLDKNTLALYTTDRATLTATIVPASAKIQWTSSDPQVAKVSETGEIKATGEGTADITASAGDKQAICKVTVTASIFVSGYYSFATSVSNGILWKNGEKYEMKDVYYRDNYRSVFVYDGDVYVAGSRRNSAGTYDFSQPALWKNGGIQTLEMDANGKGGDARDVFVTGGDVYVVGLVNFLRSGTTNSYYHRAALWKNGKLQLLTNNTFDNPYASSVFVQGNDVYVAGVTDGTIDFKTVYLPSLWKNGQLQQLSNKAGWAESIFVAGGNVYVAGSIENGTISGGLPKYAPVLWKNGEVQILDSDNLGFAHSVCVAGQDVYVADSDSRIWKNGVKVFEHETGSLYSVFVYNNDVYAAGYEEVPVQIGTRDESTLWKNGERQELPKTGYDEVAYSVFVK